MIYGYIRVSTDKQTVENQRFEINNYCEKHNISIDKWVEETISGTKHLKDRKLGYIIRKMKKRDTLICSELSRLGRNMFMIFSILYECMNRGLQIWTIKDNYKLGDDVNSKILAFAFGLSAELERNLISQRTKEALARLKEDGVILGRRYKLIGQEGKIQKMLNNRTTRTDIAKHFNVGLETVTRFIKAFGLIVPSIDQNKANKRTKQALERAKADGVVLGRPRKKGYTTPN